MTPEEFEKQRRISAAALARVVEEASGAPEARTPEGVLGPSEPVSTSAAAPAERGETPPWNPPTPPDLRPVNEAWRTSGPSSSAISTLFGASRESHFEAQQGFNSKQVQLDNALVEWTSEHFAATHRHFDRLIDSMQRRMDDIDTRHRELERELVRHVHEMARRIDVVLGEGERGRVSHEAALRAVRDRLRALEEKLL